MLKRISILLLIIALSVVGIEPIKSVRADAVNQNKGIKIDENTFPDELIRENISNSIDDNKDGYLSKAEIESVTVIGLEALTAWEIETELYNKKYTKKEEWARFGEIDCKGLEIFKNAKRIEITTFSDKKGKLLNFDKLTNLHNVKIIHLDGVGNIKKYNFSKFKKLKYVSLNSCGNVNSIKFCKNSKVKKITMYGTSSSGNLNMSSLKKLKTFISECSGLKKVTFGKKNVNLKYVEISGSPYKEERNKKMKSLDFSKVKNLEKLYIDGLYNLRKLKLGKKPKLKVLQVSATKKLKKVSLKGCKILNKSKHGVYRTL